MDHLALPHDRISEPARVPCLCADSELFDGGEFATFPERAGWPGLVTPPNDFPIYITYNRIASHSLHSRPHSRPQEDKILQSWCFFGLLHVVLAPHGLYNAQDFISMSQASGERYLNTMPLPLLFQRWYAYVSVLDDSGKRSIAEHVKSSLILVTTALPLLDTPAFSDFDESIKISMKITVDLVSGFCRKGLDMPYDWMVTSSYRMGELAEKRMQLGGWCPFEIAHAQRMFLENAGAMWYLQHMRKPDIQVSHADCNSSECRHLQITPGAYATQHFRPGCTCRMVGPDLKELEDVLKEGCYPVLEVSGHTIHNVSITLRRSTSLDFETESYVALSHVWVDGLGNPDSTTLPACQILRLYGLLSGISGRSYWQGLALGHVVEQRRLLLWCDTLCCPTSGLAKAIAIDRMKAVYTDAAYVLVLDKQLECYASTDMTPQELGVRILTSRWNKRLWTYQEAGLADKLLVQLRDGPYDPWNIISSYRNGGLNLLGDRCQSIVCSKYNALRNWLKRNAPGSISWLRDAAVAFAVRRVSVDSDQAVCLATVLGLPAGPVALHKEQAFETLWKLISQTDRGIPESIIFNGYPRSGTVGFRWAPASLLRPIHGRSVMELTVFEDDTPGILTSRGMCVRRPGWKIRNFRGVSLVHDMIITENEASEMIKNVRSPHGIYTMQQRIVRDVPSLETLSELLSDSSKEWYVILQNHERWDWTAPHAQQLALLAHKDIHESGLTFCRSKMIVTLDRLRPAFETAARVEYACGDAIRRSWAVKVPALMERMHDLCKHFITVLPQAMQIWPTSLLGMIWGRLSKMMKNRIAELRGWHTLNATTLSTASRLVKDEVGEEVLPLIGRSMFNVWTGNYLEVAETYDKTTTWYID